MQAVLATRCRAALWLATALPAPGCGVNGSFFGTVWQAATGPAAQGSPGAASAETAAAAGPPATCAPAASPGQVVVPQVGAAPSVADSGPAAADFAQQIQDATASLAAMALDAKQLQRTDDASCRAWYADDFASRQNELAAQLTAAAGDAIDDASGSDAAIVGSLASTSAQLVGALKAMPGVPIASFSQIAQTASLVAKTPTMARGTPMSAAGAYFTIPWGSGVPAGSNPSSANAGFTPQVPAANPDGSLVTAARPALPSGDTGGWTHNLGTQPFGTGPAPSVAFTAHQGGQGNCSELSGFNAVAAAFPQIVIDHLQKVGTTADGLDDLYQAKLYINGSWQTLQFDASTPSNNAAANTTDRSEFWMPLYEKAIASVYGTYDAGDFILVMQTLTGSQELYGYSDPNQALVDIHAGYPEEAGPTAPAGWYDATTGEPAAQGAANAFDLIDDHEYAVVGHTATTVTVLNPWNSTPDGTGQITLSNAAFLRLFGQFATLLPAGETLGPAGH